MHSKRSRTVYESIRKRQEEGKRTFDYTTTVLHSNTKMLMDHGFMDRRQCFVYCMCFNVRYLVVHRDRLMDIY